VSSEARLAAHLAGAYDISVSGIGTLDSGVFRVDRSDGPSWVARVFPPARALEGVEGDAAILRGLERAGFPAERCAHPNATSIFEEQAVLVSEFVEPAPALRPGRTAAILGALLGRLHANPGSGLREGGAWHHLSFVGGPREEIAAARERLEDAQSRVGLRELEEYHRVCDAVEALDDCHDLTHAFVHPDFVSVNAIPTADERLVIVDWTGAGRGPRLWSLGFLLWACGNRPRLVDAAVSRYRRHVTLEPDELARLAGAIRARAVTLECWSFCAGRRALAETAQRISTARDVADAIAFQAQRAFERGDAR
jgi:Ser/Thr protein kinase RdoA (MazF antagonist)